MLGVASTRARLPLEQDNETRHSSHTCHSVAGTCLCNQWSIHRSANEKHFGNDRYSHLRIIEISPCVTSGMSIPPPSSVSSGWLVLGVETPLGSRRQCRRLCEASLRFSNSRDLEMRTSKAAVLSMCQNGCDQPHSDVGGGSLQTQSVPTPLQNAYDVFEHCPVAVVPWL